jgi:hypothetical protein
MQISMLVFEQALRKIYDEALEPAIKDAGYLPVRVDDVAHNKNINTAYPEHSGLG